MDEELNEEKKGKHIVIDPVGEKTDLNQCPICTAHPDCFAWMEGYCTALSKRALPDGCSGDCSFYKNREANLAEARKCYQRLVDEGRADLIEKYVKPMAAMGMLDDEIQASERFADEFESYRESNFQKTVEDMLSAEDWDEDDPEDDPENEPDSLADQDLDEEEEDELFDESDDDIWEDGGE